MKCLLLLLVILISYSEPAVTRKPLPPDQNSNEIYLYDLGGDKKKPLVLVKEINIPFRIYAMKTRSGDKTYRYFFSGKDGHLDPATAFVAGGTIVRGDRLGGSRNTFYFLGENGWEKGGSKEAHSFFTDDEDRTPVTRYPRKDSPESPQLPADPPTHSGDAPRK